MEQVFPSRSGTRGIKVGSPLSAEGWDSPCIPPRLVPAGRRLMRNDTELCGAIVGAILLGIRTPEQHNGDGLWTGPSPANEAASCFRCPQNTFHGMGGLTAYCRRE
jgi:hypothetical protein